MIRHLSYSRPRHPQQSGWHSPGRNIRNPETKLSASYECILYHHLVWKATLRG